MIGQGSAKAEGDLERGRSDPRLAPSGEGHMPGQHEVSPGYRFAHPGYGWMCLIQSASSCQG